MEPKKLKLEDIMFPLATKDVYADFGDNKFTKIPGKKALVNMKVNEPISIIGHDYEIITNSEAYEYGKQCMRTLFKMGVDGGIETFNIISPGTNSFCHIDLVMQKSEFVTFKDKFIPFVRVTNSYNKMFKLSFKIGVCRFICLNGVIFDSDAIQFQYSHIKGAKKLLNFNIKSGEFERILNKFKSDIEILREKSLPKDYSFLIFCKALGLTFDLNNGSELKRSREKEKLDSYRINFNNKMEKYVNELGNNFYALYNVITDIGTHGFDEDRLFVAKVNRRQTRAGNWLSQISGMLGNGDIDYNEYLKDYLELLKN